MWELELIIIFHKGEFSLGTTRGVSLFGSAFTCVIKKRFPPLRPSTLIVRTGGWVVGLTFGLFDHVGNFFFKFLGLYDVWHGGGTILKSV